MKNIFLIFILILISCRGKQQEFSIENWNYKEDTFYVRRKFLIEDLITNKLYKGMSFDSVVQLLGSPADYNSTPNSIEYEIEEIYGSDIDPIRGSYIAITLDSDSIVSSVEFVKWKN